MRSFPSKQKQFGQSDFGIAGKFYDQNQNEMRANIATNQIEIVRAIQEEEFAGSDQDSTLRVMRTGKEDVIPNFSPDITEYYLIVPEDSLSLPLEVEASHKKAQISIQGNGSFRSGINEVQIIVTSQDGSNQTTYRIFVTKTNEPEKANAKLLTLAVEFGLLAPEFESNHTQYKTEVPPHQESLNILAIPESMLAQVKILGNGELQDGINEVQVVVLAENGITEKTYRILVYKRTEEEQRQEELAIRENETKLKNIYEAQRQYETSQRQKTNWLLIIGLILLSVIFLITIAKFVHIHLRRNSR